MKIKLDENMPDGLVQRLESLGHDVDTAASEGLAGHSDPEVWRGAQADGRFLVTQDLDFSDLRTFQPGTHTGVMLVRLVNPSRRELIARVVEAFLAGSAEWEGAFVVLTSTKIRVRK